MPGLVYPLTERRLRNERGAGTLTAEIRVRN